MVTPGADPIDPIDPAALERLRRVGGDTLVARMIGLFVSNAPTRMESAREARAAGDPAQLARAVHSLKSSAGNLGAHRVQRLAEQIEILADAGDAAGAAERFPALERAFDDAFQRLTTELRERQE